MAAASNVHQLQHYGSSIRVELNKIDSLVSQAKAIDAHQVLGLTQAFGPHFHLPNLFECRPRVGHAIVPPFLIVSGDFTYRDRTETGDLKVVERKSTTIPEVVPELREVFLANGDCGLHLEGRLCDIGQFLGCFRNCVNCSTYHKKRPANALVYTVAQLQLVVTVHHGLVPLVLVRLVLRGDGKTLSPGVQHDHVLVLGVGPLVDVEARLQRHRFLRDGGLAAEFLLALVVLQAGRATFRSGAEHEVPPVHGLLLAKVAALPHVLAALEVTRLALHDTRYRGKSNVPWLRSPPSLPHQRRHVRGEARVGLGMLLPRVPDPEPEPGFVGDCSYRRQAQVFHTGEHMRYSSARSSPYSPQLLLLLRTASSVSKRCLSEMNGLGKVRRKGGSDERVSRRPSTGVNIPLKEKRGRGLLGEMAMGCWEAEPEVELELELNGLGKSETQG
ncbi:hypothetical protein FQN60_007210 [Etheostoma spectabile]|uniref:Uncharacterized protein n=1 Tax=Etheostoma spectabile TaxID=54343 RepID=A0A5J5CG96_9PERO|nr:hypothetical protein FQN60_007210 [Etheostoma spectabile]